MDDDPFIRAAAFRFLDERSSRFRDVLPIDVLRRGFDWHGTRVPLMGPQGIFKPAVLREVPLSITTVPEVLGEERPYEDGFDRDGLLVYRYRGTDVDHRDNRGLRLAMQRQTPLIYLHGLVPGLYEAEWPAFIVGDDPRSLSFTVAIDDRKSAAPATSVGEALESAVRRAYAMRSVRSRMHQQVFRQRVLCAYAETCAICRLRHAELLDAAHILPDSDPRGVPVVPNGPSLCKLHHAAFDENIVGVTPDLTVSIRRDVLDEEDGPMLLHGLKEFDGARLHVPRRTSLQPNRGFLEERFARFSRSA